MCGSCGPVWIPTDRKTGQKKEQVQGKEQEAKPEPAAAR